nr:pdz domain containing protein [Hymenolepis microstoma]
MPSSETESSSTSSSSSDEEEKVSETHEVDSKSSKTDEGTKDSKNDKQTEEAKGDAKKDEKPKETNEENGNTSEDELVIEYTVETSNAENQPKTEGKEVNHEQPSNSSHSEKKVVEGEKEKTTSDTVKMEKASNVLTPIAVEAPPQPGSNGEVVEEVPRSVKEQIAIFANLNIQETHGRPKPGVSSAFAGKPNNVNKSPSAHSDQAPKGVSSVNSAAVYSNTMPKPFEGATDNVIKPVSKQQIEFSPVQSQPDGTTFERPQPLDRPSVPPPQPKKFVISKGLTPLTTPMTFGTPFGNAKQTIKASPEVSPSQYIGPDVIAQTSRPPMMIRLRRPGPEAPWGFAVFGGADYGCPPFISRVTLHSIAARAGLEVGDIVVSICDTAVQSMYHSQVKAEILRAGNELDFMVVKQGIDKEILAQRAPNLLRTSLPSPGPTMNQTPVQKTSSTWSRARSNSSSYNDKVTRTRSFRLLDEHLNAMSSQPVMAPKMSPSRPADVFLPTRSYYNDYPTSAGSTMGRTYQATHTANYSEMNRTNYSNTYSPGTGHTVYIQKAQPLSEISANRTYIATPVATNQTWRNTSPTRVYYDSAPRLARPNNWSALNQQMNYYGSRNSIERSSADDPGLMTQYYGTQKTSYVRHHPQRHIRENEMIHQQSLYQSNTTNGWTNPSPRQSIPTNIATYRPPVQQNYFSSTSNYQDQEQWSTSGSVQPQNAGWL